MISIDVIRRFEDKFITEPNSGCWIWFAASDDKGYGRFRIGSKLDGSRQNAIAPRVSWLIYRGDLPEELCVLHRCDNPACVNPDHLFLGTHLDNMHDCVQKNRTSKGERHSRIQKAHIKPGPGHHLHGKPGMRGTRNGQSKLTEDRIREIRADGRTNFEIATEYGISFQQVSRIKRRERWAHVK